MAHRSSRPLQNVASVLDAHNKQPDAKSRASLLHPPRILVKDPPRDQLRAVPAEDSAFILTRFPGNLVTDTPGSSIYISHTGESLVQKSPRRRRARMAKKRRSLQSLFIPSFLSSPTTDVFSSYAGRARSHSMANQSNDRTVLNGAEPVNTTQVTSPRDSPPEFLLDDDPFANLSTIPTFITPSPTPIPISITPLETPPPVQTPRSPLTPHTSDLKPSFLSSPPSISRQSVPGISRTLSGRARPAYSKPAFAPRPSLPSLHTLARMNVVLPRKVRKGRVGARLPFEPWDQLDVGRSSEESTTSQEGSVQSSPHITPTDIITGVDSSSKDNSDDTLTSGEEGLSTFASQEPETSFIGQDESSYSADSEVSLDSLDSLDDDDYITSSELSYLSRSTSLTSSFLISSSEYQWPSFSNPNDNISSAEDSDILSSSSDDFIFPDSHFDSHNIISSYWSSDDLLDSLSGDVSASALYSELFHKSDMKYEPGTSAGTIRPSTDLRDRSSSPQVRTPADDADELVDGSGRENAPRGEANSGGRWEQSSGSNVRRGGNNESGRANGNTTNRFGGRGEDEDEDEKRRRINRSQFSTPSESEASASDEDSTDDYGEPAPMKAPPSSSDDDVPLARCIPNALKAQNTIRRQVQEEREQRRAARAAARVRSSSTPRGGPPTRPSGAGEPPQRGPMSSSQEAALHASRSLRHAPHKTVPTSEMQPFSPEDLTGKLQNMDMRELSSSATQFSRSTTRREPSRPRSAGHGMKDPTSPVLASSTIGPPTDHRTLRPSRSFHRPEGRRSEEHHAVPLPIDAGRKLARSLTRREDGPSTSPQSYPTRIQDENLPRPSLPRRSGEEPRKLTKYPEPRSTRSSSEMERPRRSSPTRPPVPPLPPDALAISTSPPTARGPVIQQRVFIGDMQRFNMVEIGPSTNAGDVIEMVEAQGSLKGWVGSGDWMVWEVAQDFGMERPIRSFELLSDVQASWNKDKLMNTFVIKLTALAVPLSRSAIPSSSPTYAGYVEWESKRGKWNKRWLQLREHCLWLSKRDNGRDEVLLCSLSNFDAYFITRLHKAPRPFSFAVKSTDKLSFFENTADYLHIFSCGEKEGVVWMENILLARSYVLYQERNVLFNPKATNGNAGSAGTLSRAGTRKASSAHRPVAQPLISGVTAPMTIAQQLQSNDVFEPGSLLRKHA
ncbi:hypothetical protein C0995_004711 [Termitomyces sp. Mi166|nr:hypothetical protein C0995_004711 [Termitomyces sp. Mi166\